MSIHVTKRIQGETTIEVIGPKGEGTFTVRVRSEGNDIGITQDSDLILIPKRAIPAIVAAITAAGEHVHG